TLISPDASVLTVNSCQLVERLKVSTALPPTLTRSCSLPEVPTARTIIVLEPVLALPPLPGAGVGVGAGAGLAPPPPLPPPVLPPPLPAMSPKPIIPAQCIH